MDSIKFGQDAKDVWHVTQAPLQTEFTLSEICGANVNIIHCEGRHLVLCNEVWYLPTGYDTGHGVIHARLDRDDRGI